MMLTERDQITSYSTKSESWIWVRRIFYSMSCCKPSKISQSRSLSVILRAFHLLISLAPTKTRLRLQNSYHTGSLEIVAIYCMISTDRQHQLVYSISLLKQVRFITTDQVLSLVTRFMLSSLEPIKCMPFSRESVPKFGTLFLIPLNYLNVRPFVKR